MLNSQHLDFNQEPADQTRLIRRLDAVDTFLVSATKVLDVPANLWYEGLLHKDAKVQMQAAGCRGLLLNLHCSGLLSHPGLLTQSGMSAWFRNLCCSVRLSAPLGQTETASEWRDRRERGRQDPRHNTSLSLHCGSSHYISHTHAFSYRRIKTEDNLAAEAVCSLFFPWEYNVSRGFLFLQMAR